MLVLAACSGEIGQAPGDRSTSGGSTGGSDGQGAFAGEATGSGSGEAPGVGDAPGAACSNQASSTPVVAAQRLTRDGYAQSVAFLFDRSVDDALRRLPDDVRTDGIAVAGPISPLDASSYFEVAELIAASVTAEPDRLTGCPNLEDACVRPYVRGLVRQAFRGAAAWTEHADRLQVLYDQVARETDSAFALELVVQAILSSPMFLYVAEPTPTEVPAGTVVPVTGSSMASRLAYFLWNQPPTDELLGLAVSGALSSPEQAWAVADSMLQDPRAEQGFLRFIREWLDLDALRDTDKLESTHPEFDPVALVRSLERSMVAWLWEGDGAPVSSIFTARTIVPFAPVGEYLGMSGLVDGLLQEVAPPERAGLLTHPAVLAHLATPEQSDPVLRGVFVRDLLLCDRPPPPPNDVEIRPPDPVPGLTTRERFAQHSEDARCAGCHAFIDPIGFGFEHFDQVGRYRTSDDGRPVDASGELVGTDVDGPFVGVTELNAMLADSHQVRRCVARRLFRTALRRVELDVESCELEQLFQRGDSQGWNMRDLFLAVVQTQAFTHQRVEGTP